MAWFYERESRTLILRPLVPLRPRRTYAVVLTNRLRGANGQPVRSPFDHVHHVRQTEALASLPRHLAAHPELYGSLATAGWSEVAFAWTYTTQSVTDDLDTVREGLYGRGSMARLATQFPGEAAPMTMQGGPNCMPAGPQTYVATGDQFRATLTSVGPLLGLDARADAGPPAHVREPLAHRDGGLRHALLPRRPRARAPRRRLRHRLAHRPRAGEPRDHRDDPVHPARRPRSAASPSRR